MSFWPDWLSRVWLPEFSTDGAACSNVLARFFCAHSCSFNTGLIAQIYYMLYVYFTSIYLNVFIQILLYTLPFSLSKFSLIFLIILKKVRQFCERNATTKNSKFSFTQRFWNLIRCLFQNFLTLFNFPVRETLVKYLVWS